MRDVTMTVSDMACEGCVESVREAVEGVSGVESVEVSLDRGVVRVRAGEETTDRALETAVEDAGYTVESAA